MFIAIVWIILSFIVASQGSHRRIGWGASFFISLLLSPIIGFLAVIASVPKPYEVNDQKANRPRKRETESERKARLYDEQNGSFNIEDYRSN